MIPDINLIPKVERNQSDSKLLAMLLSIIVLLILGLFVWQYFNARSQITTLQAEESSLIAQRDELQTNLNDTSTVNQGTLEQSIEFVETVSYPVSPLIDETKKLLPSNAYLRDYAFDATSVSITVDFETLRDVSTYVSRLANSAYFMDSQVGSISSYDIGNESEMDGETNFDVETRQTTQITLLINNTYLSTGGGQ